MRALRDHVGPNGHVAAINLVTPYGQPAECQYSGAKSHGSQSSRRARVGPIPKQTFQDSPSPAHGQGHDRRQRQVHPPFRRHFAQARHDTRCRRQDQKKPRTQKSHPWPPAKRPEGCGQQAEHDDAGNQASFHDRVIGQSK